MNSLDLMKSSPQINLANIMEKSILCLSVTHTKDNASTKHADIALKKEFAARTSLSKYLKKSKPRCQAYILNILVTKITGKFGVPSWVCLLTQLPNFCLLPEQKIGFIHNICDSFEIPTNKSLRTLSPWISTHLCFCLSKSSRYSCISGLKTTREANNL
jgi:hypothetical protein